MTAAALIQQWQLETVQVGPKFMAMAGSFKDNDFLNYLHADKNMVDYVEPNQIYKSDVVIPRGGGNAVMRDAEASNWGLARINHRSNSDLQSYTYDENAGQGIHAYVLDSGVNVDHKDFGGRAFKEANFISNEDDDDLGGHGTHVAGKIAGTVHGVAKGATIHAVKILDKSGSGTTSGLIKAISHVIEVAEPGKSLINLSLSGPKSKILDDILREATQSRNIPVFVSAGNAGTDACYFSPSSSKDVFTVGATDSNDKVPNYSDVGKCVSIYAPGSNIKSTWIGSDDATKNLDGTSMANPHVAGIAAILMSQKNYGSVDELYKDLRSSATTDALTFGQSKKSTSTNYNLLAYYGDQ
ncbi:peptidase S8/S53 domain-containing protein [Cunninghamella echinulata]|nr:peptidase S8/S53 domain-containing protein [Cunninghamella echinulata]